jgi:hypothetical protein
MPPHNAYSNKADLGFHDFLLLEKVAEAASENSLRILKDFARNSRLKIQICLRTLPERERTGDPPRREFLCFRRTLYQMLNPLQEPGCRSAIHQAVIKGQRQRHHRPDRYLVIHYHRFLEDGPNAQDSTLGNVDDGHKLFNLQTAEIGNGKSAAL